MIKKQAGRKKIAIDWNEIEKYLIAGVSGNKIANSLGICDDTLFARCVEDHKVNFSDYSAKKKQKGDSLLYVKQYQSAMGGNVSMLIWLGKQRLGQTDQPKDTQEFNGSLANLLGVMHMIKSSEDFDSLVQLANKNAAELKDKSK